MFEKNRMKAFVFLLGTALLLAFGLAGCGNNGDGTPGEQIINPPINPPVNPPVTPPNAADLDGDGIPNEADAFPNEVTLFASFAPPVTLSSFPGGTASTPLAINDSGLVVGNAETGPALPVEAAAWQVDGAGNSTGTPTALTPPLPGDFSSAYGNNNLDQVVGESARPDGTFVAILWNDGAATPVEFPLLGGQGTWSAAFDINNSGTVVGEAENGLFEPRAVVWSVDAAGAVLSGPVELPLLTGGNFSTAATVNDGNVVVGEATDAAGKLHAVAWTPDGQGGFQLVDLGTAGEVSSRALAINEAGGVGGEAEVAQGVSHGMLWTPQGTSVTRSDLGTAGSASSLNDLHRIVGWTVAGSISMASIWDDRNTNPSEFDLIIDESTASQAFGMNGLGQVIGIAGSTGFVATPN